MLLHLRLVLHLALTFITFAVGITFAGVIIHLAVIQLVPHSAKIQCRGGYLFRPGGNSSELVRLK